MTLEERVAQLEMGLDKTANLLERMTRILEVHAEAIKILKDSQNHIVNAVSPSARLG